MPDGKLTPKQKRFVQEYQVDSCATRAAIRAGYSAKNADVTGPRLLGNVGICEAIEKGRQKMAEKAEITKETVLAALHGIAQGGANATARDRIRAYTEINQMLGFHAPREFSGKVAVRRDLSDLPEEELRRIAEATQKSLPPAEPEKVNDGTSRD